MRDVSLRAHMCMEPNDFESMFKLAEHVGLLAGTQANDAPSGCGAYTEATLRDMSTAQLAELFSKEDIHVIPEENGEQKQEIFDKGFSVETCECLDIDVSAEREFQGGVIIVMVLFVSVY